MKKVLVVGSGGREHALAWKLLQSPQVAHVYIAPGNGGTNGAGLESVPIEVTDHETLIAFVKDNGIDLTVIGPDDALARGIVDDFKDAGLSVFGCSKAASEIEASKAFAKELMLKHDIKTASHQTFSVLDEAQAYVVDAAFPFVVKASGLALGKGVYICNSKEEANTALSEMMEDKKFGDSGSEVVIEEFLIGTELSTHAFCDGETAIMFPPSQDHKTIYEDNTGPNTGGMGVVAPLPWADQELMEKVKTQIVDPTLAALKESDATFSGLLYPGLMEHKGELSVIEFNARFGDPETQCYMRLLESDLYDVLYACATGTLKDVEVTWSSKCVACVMMASAGYPESSEKGKLITGIEDAESDPDVLVFHSGTAKNGDDIVTNGGRVLGVTALSDTLEEAIATAYKAVAKIDFEGKHFRTDIGQATLNKK